MLKCIRMLTFLPLEQIDEMAHWEGAQLNRAKEILAYELTRMVHGEEEAEKAQAGARALFSAGVDAEVPTLTLRAEDYRDGSIGLPALLVKAGFAKSTSEARTAITQGGVTLDGEKITDVKAVLTPTDLAEGKLLRKGKKNYIKVVNG